jgi:hypothetical protein
MIQLVGIARGIDDNYKRASSSTEPKLEELATNTRGQAFRTFNISKF